MADYKKAITKVLKNEGGYVNDPKDNGGETYKGISRNNWPGWSGWQLIDICKKDSKNFPKNAYQNPTLTELVIGFYKLNFWNKIGGDGIKDQDLANEIVDTAVLGGFKPALKSAQKIVGIPQTGEFSDVLKKKLNSF